jgi:hypothetical protein
LRVLMSADDFKRNYDKAQARADKAAGKRQPAANGMFVRTTGWERPWHNLQLGSWVLLPMLVAGFYAVCTPALDEVAAIITGVVFGICAVATGAAACITTSIDPGIGTDGEAELDADGYCTVCKKGTAHQTKHCPTCNK